MTIHAPLPILKRGLTRWDPTLIPRPEIERRWRSLRSRLAELDLDALLVYGDLLEAGNVLYLTNFAPFEGRMPAVVLVTRDEIEAVIKVSSRDLAFVQPYVWCRAHSCDFLKGDIGGQIGDLVSARGLERLRVGLAGARRVPHRLYEALAPIADMSRNDEMDRLMLDLRRQRTSADKAAMRAANDKLAEVMRRVADADSPADEVQLAALADYAGRMAGVQDIQFLFYGDGGEEPASDPFATRIARPQPLRKDRPTGLFCALQMHGYWAEASLSLFDGGIAAHRQAAERAERQLDHLVGTLVAGAAAQPSPTFRWHGIGLDRIENPQFSPGEFPSGGDYIAAHTVLETADGPVYHGRTLAI